ncbi:MAG TPA: hypothetical protein PKA64_14135 [Myxococcota bacterium]|nr:hypothetical protein [Myxococcota bacterium]
MSLYRHSEVILDQGTLIGTEVTTRVWRIRPAEGDAVTDPVQAWRCQVVAERQGAGGINVRLQTSYDRELWADAVVVDLGEDNDALVIPAIDVLAPFVRAHVGVSPAPEGQTAPTWRARVRLVSNGPFKLQPV